MSQIDWEKYAYQLLVVTTRYFSNENYEKYCSLRDEYLSLNPSNDVEETIKRVIENVEYQDKDLISKLSRVESVLKSELEKFYSNPLSKQQQGAQKESGCGCSKKSEDPNKPEEIRRWWI